MAMQSGLLTKPNYGHWIKAGTSLLYVKDGLVDEIADQSRKLHHVIRANVQQKSPHAASNICTACTSRDIRRVKTKPGSFHGTKWTVNCPVNVCDVWLDEIMKYYGGSSPQHIVWQNVDPRKWPSSEWEVAKTFMPHGSRDQKGPMDSDCAALLCLMLNCTHFYNIVSNSSIIQQVLSHRHRIMHAATLEVDKTDFILWTNDMIRLLEDPVCFIKHPSCKTAATKIKELQQNPIDISLCKEQEVKVLRQMTLELKNDMQKFRTEMDTCQSKTEKLPVMEEDISELKTQYMSLAERLDTQEKTLKANDVDSTTDVNTADVRLHLIDVYQKNCTDVPIYPLTPEVTGKLPSLFVKPCIKVRPRTSKIAQTETMDSLAEIFKTSKKIYIAGDAGIGKSTFCDYMVYVWCCAHKGTDIHISPKDSEIMKTFVLLFYISLRYALPGQSIEEMIESQLDIPATAVVCDQCLIVLDGLDEWQAKHEGGAKVRFQNTDIPELKTKCNCTIVTTSRPWKLEMLRLGVGDIDKELTITGLDSKSIDMMANKLMKDLNKMQESDKQVNDFICAMGDNNLDQFMKVPVLLKQMLCLWYDGISLGNSQYKIYINMIERQLRLAEQDQKLKNILRSKSVTADNLRLMQYLQEWPLCQEYQDIILALARMAFHTLFNENRESALVFDHEVTQMYGLSGKDVDACLKVGLLSQKQLYGKITQRKKSLNFIHKSHQEFFAAVYLATNGRKLEDVKKFCYSLAMIHEVENVMVFLCGLNPVVCREIVTHLRQLVSADQNLTRYRQNEEEGFESYKHIFQNVQKVILSLTKELCNNGAHETLLPINDMVVDKTNIIRISESLKSIDMTCLESIFIETNDSGNEVQQMFQEVVKAASACETLVKIWLEDHEGILNAADICTLINNSKSVLKSLHLSNVGLTDLPSYSFIKRNKSPFNAIWNNFFPFLIQFEHVQLTQEQVQFFMNFLSKSNSLQTLSIKGHSSRDVSGGSYTLNLSSHKNLQHLSLQNIHAKKVVLDPVHLVSCKFGEIRHSGCIKSLMKCLQKAERLENFVCEDVDDENDKKAIIDTLPNIKSLKTISISRLDFGDITIAVSPHMKNLETIHMFKVRMTNMVFKRLLDKLPPQRLSIKLDMVNLSMAEGTPHIPDYIRKSENRFTVMTHYRNSDGNWHMVFDKKETEDISELSI